MSESAIVPAVSVPSRGQSIGLWIFRLFVVAMFLPWATIHLIGWFGWQQYIAHEFDLVGLGQWLRYVTGTLELLGVVLVMIPRYSALGGLLLLAVDTGAFFAEVTVLHVDWIHTVIYAAILVVFIYVQRQSLAALRR